MLDRTYGDNVKYTEHPGVEHNAWDKAYAEPELFPWLLQQKVVVLDYGCGFQDVCHNFAGRTPHISS
jgi:hypothetical protein